MGSSSSVASCRRTAETSKPSRKRVDRRASSLKHSSKHSGQAHRTHSNVSPVASIVNGRSGSVAQSEGGLLGTSLAENPPSLPGSLTKIFVGESSYNSLPFFVPPRGKPVALLGDSSSSPPTKGVAPFSYSGTGSDFDLPASTDANAPNQWGLTDEILFQVMDENLNPLKRSTSAPNATFTSGGTPCAASGRRVIIASSPPANK